MHRKLIGVVVVAAVMASAPDRAHAQGYFVPFIGYDFGGDAGECPSLFADCKDRRTSYGFTAGFLGGIVGLEGDLGYAPDFFGTSDSFSNNSVLTLMGNLVISLPLGPVRPYGVAGIGLVRTKVALTSGSLFSLDNSAFGFDIGGGVMLLFGAHLGVRGDLRYFRSTGETNLADLALPTNRLNFGRASIGLVLH